MLPSVPLCPQGPLGDAEEPGRLCAHSRFVSQLTNHEIKKHQTYFPFQQIFIGCLLWPGAWLRKGGHNEKNGVLFLCSWPSCWKRQIVKNYHYKLVNYIVSQKKRRVWIESCRRCGSRNAGRGLDAVWNRVFREGFTEKMKLEWRWKNTREPAWDHVDRQATWRMWMPVSNAYEAPNLKKGVAGKPVKFCLGGRHCFYYLSQQVDLSFAQQGDIGLSSKATR